MLIYDIFLDRIEPNGIVVGTNNAKEVPVGTVFTKLVKVRVEGALGSSTSIQLWSIPVALRLTDVIIYRRSISAVPRGWGVGLHFKGSGLAEVVKALADKVKFEFIHLRVTESDLPPETGPEDFDCWTSVSGLGS